MSTHALRPRLLTGDTPTGKLHLGHWVGSLENRVKLQDHYECFFIIANVHAFTTRAHLPEEIRQNVLDIALDYLSVGIDPERSAIFVQSEVPAIAELTFFFSMLLTHARVLQNPTIKQEIREKGLGDAYPFGFLLYAVGQVADILAFKAECVPVGEDQLPHIEMTREIARRFNQLYCGVKPELADEEHLAHGGLFPIPRPLVGRIKRLIGLSPPDADGRFRKMSKSFNNALYLSDSEEEIRKKVMQIYTDPARIRATDPGTVENNPLWTFHDAFTQDRAWVEEAKERYRTGQIGDVECKKRLVESLLQLTEPMRKRRQFFEKDPGEVLRILAKGTKKANQITEETLQQAKEKMRQDYFPRNLDLSML